VERAIVFGALCLEIGEQNSLNSPITSIEISPVISRTDSYLAIAFRVLPNFTCKTNKNF